MNRPSDRLVNGDAERASYLGRSNNQPITSLAYKARPRFEAMRLARRSGKALATDRSTSPKAK